MNFIHCYHKMEEFMDEFMAAMEKVFPDLLVQFEDFSTDNAFKYLGRYRNVYRVFNDDVSYFYGSPFKTPFLISYSRFKAPAPWCSLDLLTPPALHQLRPESPCQNIVSCFSVLAVPVLALQSSCSVSSKGKVLMKRLLSIRYG